MRVAMYFECNDEDYQCVHANLMVLENMATRLDMVSLDNNNFRTVKGEPFFKKRVPDEK